MVHGLWDSAFTLPGALTLSSALALPSAFTLPGALALPGALTLPSAFTLPSALALKIVSFLISGVRIILLYPTGEKVVPGPGPAF